MGAKEREREREERQLPGEGYGLERERVRERLHTNTSALLEGGIVDGSAIEGGEVGEGAVKLLGGDGGGEEGGSVLEVRLGRVSRQLSRQVVDGRAHLLVASLRDAGEARDSCDAAAVGIVLGCVLCLAVVEAQRLEERNLLLRHDAL